MKDLQYEIKMSARSREHFELKLGLEKLRAQMVSNLIQMEQLMSDNNETFFEMDFDEIHNLNIQLKVHHSRTLDKERLSIDLGVSKSDIKTPFLMTCVEEKRLTTDKYESYFFPESETKVNIRKKKKKKPKGNKKQQGL
jgi:hypothetical protein